MNGELQTAAVETEELSDAGHNVPTGHRPHKPPASAQDNGAAAVPDVPEEANGSNVEAASPDGVEGSGPRPIAGGDGTLSSSEPISRRRPGSKPPAAAEE
jgi:hypothetical protein